MSKSNIVVPEAKEALERFKMEAANEVGVQKHLNILTTRIFTDFFVRQIYAGLAFKHIKQAKIHNKTLFT